MSGTITDGRVGDGDDGGRVEGRVVRARLLGKHRPPEVEVGALAVCPSCSRPTAFRLTGGPWCESCWWRSPAAQRFREELVRSLAGAPAEVPS